MPRPLGAAKPAALCFTSRQSKVHSQFESLIRKLHPQSFAAFTPVNPIPADLNDFSGRLLPFVAPTRSMNSEASACVH